MTTTVAKNKTAAGYFLCRRSEATKLLEKAKTEAAEILKELKAFTPATSASRRISTGTSWGAAWREI